MASLYKKGDSQFYWMRFTIAKKRYQESTKESLKPAAQKKMEARIRQLERVESPEPIFERLMAAIEKETNKQKRHIMRRDFARRVLTDEVVKLKLEKAFAVYSKKPHSRNPSKATMDSYERIWNAFVVWVTENRPELEHMHEIDPMAAVAYMNALWAGKCTPRTFNWKLTFLRGMFTKLKLEGSIGDNPFETIEKQILQTESRKPLSREQLGSVLGNATGELHALIMIGAYTGLRLGDAVRLKWSEVDFDTMMINITPRKTKKMGKTVALPLFAPLLEELVKLPRNRGYVVPDLRKQFEKEHTAVSTMVRELYESSGITVHGERHGGRGQAACLYSFHSLRHTFITECARAGITKTIVMEVVGHGSEAVNSIYTHVDAEMIREGMKDFPDIHSKAGA